MNPEEEFAARRVGETIDGRWILEQPIGSGGMAAVYAAHTQDGQRGAVKLLHPEMCRSTEIRERFLREGMIANRIEHPGAVRILGHGLHGDEAYLVMELLEGEPLDIVTGKKTPFPLPTLLEYMDQTLDALAAAHDRGVVHRDLKPDNLFVTTGGQVKVLDFGIARVLDVMPGEFKTRTGLIMGTLSYMAPEQALAKHKEIDGRTDLFSLGAMMFRIIAQRAVHTGNSEAELLLAMATTPAAPLSSASPETSREVCAIVDMALSFSKHDRYADARAMQADVRAVRSGEPPAIAVARQQIRGEPTKAEVGASPLLVPGGGAGVGAIAAGGHTPTVAYGNAVQSAPRDYVPTKVESSSRTQAEPGVVVATSNVEPTVPDVGSPQVGFSPQLAPTVVRPLRERRAQKPPGRGLILVAAAVAALLFVGLVGIAIGVLWSRSSDGLDSGEEGVSTLSDPEPRSMDTAGTGGTSWWGDGSGGAKEDKKAEEKRKKDEKKARKKREKEEKKRKK